jgi:hypothetical protein
MSIVVLSDSISNIFPSFIGGRYTYTSKATREVVTGTIKSMEFADVGLESPILKIVGPIRTYVNDNGTPTQYGGLRTMPILPDRCIAELGIDGALVINNKGMNLTLLPKGHSDRIQSLEEQFRTTDH